MFDDPKQRLYELEQALKAAEAEEQEDLWLKTVDDLLEEEDLEPAEDMDYFLSDGELEEPDAVFASPPRRKGARPFVFLALLELAGIGLVILWWLRWAM